MKFIDHGLTPAHYRWKFLDYTDRIAPEVLQSLKAMSKKYDQVFNCYPFSSSFTWWLTGEVNLPDENEILTHLSVKDRCRLSKEDDIEHFKKKALKNFYVLRKDYLEFIEKFNLQTDWLRRDLFSLLGKITYHPNYNYSLVIAYSHAWNPKEGEDFEFTYPGWKIGLDSKDYEMEVSNAFKKQLTKYIQTTVKQFKEDGFKRATKPLDIDSVKWLVYWTIKKKSKDEILSMIDNENFAQGKDAGIDRKTLDAHFRKFKKYGLPVRG